VDLPVLCTFLISMYPLGIVYLLIYQKGCRIIIFALVLSDKMIQYKNDK
jgi:hypothetical protein